MPAPPHPAAAPEPSPTARKLGTFAGVFTPTLLTILGVILYLRLGWVVGQAGLVGAWAVIGLSVAITFLTGLSLSSIATNTRLAAGGAYGIVSRSLGLEVGGSVGLPLYLSQALVVAMYVFGFREGWLWIFPDHPPLGVDLAVFAVVFGLAWLSASVAFRVQYVVMAIIGLSLVAVLAGGAGEPVLEPRWVGRFESVGFWGVFGVFFPAATGVLAGANMSGELDRPRRAIPVGTLAALGLSAAVYLGVATWAALRIPPDELVGNYTAIIDHAAWRPIVLAGLLGATFSSAVTSMVGAPRILQAMGHNRVLPGSAWLARASPDGEPRRALLLTGAVALLGLLLRDLNTIAPLVTLFFLLTYGVVNLVVVLEGGLGRTSFRPTLRLPPVLPILGVVGCGVGMVVVQPVLSLLAVLVVAALHAGLTRRGLVGDRGDMRSGLFVSLAEWAARRANRLQGEHPRAWRPHMLVPTRRASSLEPALPLLIDLTAPEGSLQLFGVADHDADHLDTALHSARDAAQARSVFATATAVQTPDFLTGVTTGLQALKGTFFRPNLLFLQLEDVEAADDDVVAVVDWCDRHRVGVALLAGGPPDPTAGVPRVRLWVRPQQGPDPLADGLTLGNLNLAVLLSWRLGRAWRARIELTAAAQAPTAHTAAATYLAALAEDVRLPRSHTERVVGGRLTDALEALPTATLQVFGLPRGALDRAFIRRTTTAARGPCLFVLDSGRESARA